MKKSIILFVSILFSCQNQNSFYIERGSGFSHETMTATLHIRVIDEMEIKVLIDDNVIVHDSCDGIIEKRITKKVTFFETKLVEFFAIGISIPTGIRSEYELNREGDLYFEVPLRKYVSESSAYRLIWDDK